YTTQESLRLFFCQKSQEPRMFNVISSFQVSVKYNKDYNPAPGRLIENITFEDIHITSGPGEEVSLVAGYDSNHPVQEILFKDIYRDGKKVTDFNSANIHVGDYTSRVQIV
ncbi:hypothetical protein EFT87_14305, partial [Schleiferilactobacillus harbinensis]|uniref:hypothetical protein n=1 Tax=Schleiferilactobacillus harbinensis TaxID=304207 RepID=UPI0021A7BFC7